MTNKNASLVKDYLDRNKNTIYSRDILWLVYQKPVSVEHVKNYLKEKSKNFPKRIKVDDIKIISLVGGKIFILDYPEVIVIKNWVEGPKPISGIKNPPPGPGVHPGIKGLFEPKMILEIGKELNHFSG